MCIGTYICIYMYIHICIYARKSIYTKIDDRQKDRFMNIYIIYIHICALAVYAAAFKPRVPWY